MDGRDSRRGPRWQLQRFPGEDAGVRYPFIRTLTPALGALDPYILPDVDPHMLMFGAIG